MNTFFSLAKSPLRCRCILYFYFETEMAENSCSIQIRFDRERNNYERKRASPLFELENWTRNAKCHTLHRVEIQVKVELVFFGRQIYFLPALTADLVVLPPEPSDFSTALMTPTATVCLISRTANRPSGG